MNFNLINFDIKLFVLNICKRWSIAISLLLYLVLFSLVKILQLPLKSYKKENVSDYHRVSGESIIEYLHKLHNLRINNELEESEKSEIQPFHVIEKIFHKADKDHDNFLNPDELSTWINTKIQEHIHKAITENYKIFTVIDVHPKNGLISWEEYHSYFLKKNGFNESYISDHSEQHKELHRNIREIIIRDKILWKESSKTQIDHLTLDEFLCFRHPESSYSTITSLVDEIFRKFDRDDDDIITEYEFSTLLSEEENEKLGTITQEEKERRKEFREVVDLNKDGKATRKEMLNYIDPKNPRHAKEEADSLISLADVDKDGRLSLFEIFNKIDLFLRSKMIDIAKNFHDEF